MKSTKLLTFFMLQLLVPFSNLWAQCSLITKNGSFQDPKTVCAPVDFTMNVWFKFLIPVDTSKVEILFVWNDGMGSATTKPGVWNASCDSVWAEASFLYPPTDECSRTADAYLVFDGDRCTSSGHQEQTFSTWGTDEENSGVLSTDPVVAYFCEGEDIVDVTFDDNSTFNCNIGIEPDNPNRYYRWVQFIYNTYTLAGDRIPEVTVRDGSGIVHPMTDAAGNFIASLDGPVIMIPIPADGPNQTSFAISAPPGGVAGDIFEITLRNWNVCNPYDNLPTDGIPPSDLINGDNPPITTTARIEIIAPPPVVVSSQFEFCTSQNVILTANAGTADVRWYADSMLTTLLHTGNHYNPQTPPFNLNNSIPGNYTFWVTSFQGVCESAPNRVNVIIYQQPEAVNAGPGQTICADSVLLTATPPSAGTGQWTSTGPATFDDSNNPVTWARGLTFGSNQFTWTVTNGICQASDQVEIISDRKPAPAMAGPDDSLCLTGGITLSAAPPTMNGRGHWLILEGSGTLSDTTAPDAVYSNATPGNNRLLWRISSQYGACPVTRDTVLYFVDRSPGTAEGGPNVQFCETDHYEMAANSPTNSGTGLWSVLSGSNMLNDFTDPLAEVTGLMAGINRYRWTLSSHYGLCPSSSDSVTIVRDLSPGIANAGPDISLCLENSDTLRGNPPAPGTGEWTILTNPSGVNPVFSPNRFDPNAIITVLPGNEGEYVLQWTLQNGSCISRDTLHLDFGIPPPPGFAGNDSSICGLTTTLHSNTFAQGHGLWNQLTGPSTAVFIPDRYSENPTVNIPSAGEGVYTFEWMLTSGACAPSSDTVQIIFLGMPVNPSVTGNESCGPDSLELTATVTESDVIVEWYNTIGEISPFRIDESFTTPYLLVSRIYYVDSYDTLTGCKTPKLPVPANIYPVPAPPSLTGDTLCGAGSALVSGTILPPANTIYWYTDSTGTVLLHEGASYDPNVSGNMVLWAAAADTIHNCLSPSGPVNIIVHPAVHAPYVTNDSSCGPAEFTLYAVPYASGDLLYWYNAASGGSIIRIDDSLYLPLADTSRQVWIAEINDSTGCSSTRVPVEAIIHPVPAIPLIDDTSSCGPSPFTLIPTGDINTSTFRWYNQPVGGTLLQTSDTLSTGLLSSNRSYWVSGYNSETSCESPREQTDISIYPVPAPITIIGPTLVLLNQSGVIFSTTGNSTSTYHWTIPPGVTLDQDMNDFVRLSFPATGSYTLTVYEVTSHGCIGTPVSHPITVVNDSIAVDIGLYNQNACTGVDFELKPWLFGGTPPYTYNWTGDIAYLSNTNTLFTTFSPPGTGTFHLFLEVVDVNLKKAYDSVAITVFTSPTAHITTRDEVVCVGNDLQLQVETTGYDAVSHLWSGPVHNLSSYTIKEPIYTPRQPDTVMYTYQLTDVNGCRAYDSTYIFSDIPVAYFELLTEPGCSPLHVEFNNMSARAVTYSWDFGDGTTSVLETPDHTYINQSPEIKYYPVKLSVTSILGCTDDITQYAMVWPNPEASLDAIPNHACSPASITLFSTPGNLNYYWDFGNTESEVTHAFSVTHSYEAEGENDVVFNVRVITESSLHCIDSAFLNLDIYATPDADFTVNPPRDTFPRNTFEIDNLTGGSRWNYQWNLGDGRNLEVPQPGMVMYEAPGNYTITLTARSEHCTDSISKTVYLYPAPPQAKFTPPEPGCMPHTINFINNSAFADEYLWDFGDGSISTAANPTYTYYQAGIYKVSLTVRGPGGEASHSDTARVYIVPKAFFDLAPRYVYVNDESVHFFNLSDHADAFEWDFGDGETSEELNPEHTYKHEGTYDITLTVSTANNCYDLYIMKNAVMVEPSGVVEFPNAFRPGSPLEENRVFLPGIIDHVDDYHLMIFNRWGEMIFESYDQENGWDGTYQGKPAKQDVYIWKVTGTYSDGRGFTKTGDVTLLY
jgi:gliding motility-associated-like protein